MDKPRQKLLPSCHLLELFMPYRLHEEKMLSILKKTVDIGYYKGVELGVFFDKYRRLAVRNTVEQNHLNLTVFATPYLKERKMNLSSLDPELRARSVAYSIEISKIVADTGCTNFGMPSGDDPGDKDREEAKKLLADSLCKIADVCRKLGMNVTLEPLDRYAYKKQLIGPIKESMLWFEPVHAQSPNLFVHWDSAHEALGQVDLMLSLNYAKPYIAQFHLCNAILDPADPCFGDLHMDVGEAPDFITEGFLTPAIGANILREVASFPKPEGVKDTYVSIEVLGHPGDNLWHKEKTSRLFLQKCFELSGLD